MTTGGIQSLGSWRFGDQRYGDELVPSQYAYTQALAITYTIGSLAPSIPAGGLGTWIYGQPRYGNGLSISLLPRINAMGISYSISPSKYAAPIALTYTIQRPHTAPMLLYYLISQPSQFTINGDSGIVNPDQLSYAPIPVVARTLLASPILQGTKGVTWVYTALSWSELHQIIAHYNPNAPIVNIGYPDEGGTWVLRQAVMHPPVYGQMQTVMVYNVSFSFSILPTG